MNCQPQRWANYFFCTFISLAFSFIVCADPWLDTGDMQLRHELQILSDAGLLNTPLTTWPLSSQDISDSKESKDQKNLPPNIQEALNSIDRQLTEINSASNFKVAGNTRSNKLLIRDFSGDGREKSSLSFDGQLNKSNSSIRLKITATEESSHPGEKQIRLDDSYITSSLGNWKFTLGSQSRWWGPGWDGSLILSNNARPIPSLSLDRIKSMPFNNKYFHWMGPWKLNLFAGQLESERHIPKAKLLGARFNFKPTPNFEVGLSRTAQWGGKGRPESLSSLFNAIIGRDNFTTNKDTEPGNQLAGLDFRWKSPVLQNKPYAIYGQLIGEDEASYLPSKNIALIGFETWGSSKKHTGNWRAYLEASNTSIDNNNTAYNHSIYTSGYRYQGLSIGHSIDSDGLLLSMGLMLSQKNGNFWRGWAKHAELNTDGIGQNPLAPKGKKWSALGISLNRKVNKKTSLDLGTQFISEKNIKGVTNNNIEASIGFSHSF